MRSERFYTWVGIFVVGAIVLTIMGSAFFYEQYVHAKSQTYVMFFKGSLKGLGTSTSVTYRGVKIGKVTLTEVTQNKAKTKVMLPVYVEFFVENNFGFDQDPINFLIASGYVADISKPNFLTGVADIELVQTDITATTHRQLHFHGYPVFPTRNTVEKYTSLDEALKSADKMFKSIRTLVKSKEVKDTIHSTKDMADSTREMAESLDKLANNMNRHIPNITAYFTQTLRNISDAATSTRNLADYLARNPESLLRGKK